MPRTPEQSEEIRQKRKEQILDAALTVYAMRGYHGADMDAVAKEAGLAKGLVYYYFKTKQELFGALFDWMMKEGMAFSDGILAQSKHMGPLEQLMAYAYGTFMQNKRNPRMMQFAMRMPFDAYAVFGDGWKTGAAQSDLHRNALAGIIQRGMDQNLIHAPDAGKAANSFWTVFVANLFEYSRTILGGGAALPDQAAFLSAVQFGFQGLGVEPALWRACLERTLNEERGGDGK